MDRADREMCSRDVLTGHINDFVLLFKQLLHSINAQGSVSGGIGALSLSGDFLSPSELAAQATQDLLAKLLRKDELLQEAVHKRDRFLGLRFAFPLVSFAGWRSGARPAPAGAHRVAAAGDREG